MTFSALILAGGRSTRMGQDKALLRVDGETLVARQVRRVRASGAVDVLVSGRAEVDYGPVDARVVYDDLPDLGPLAGIARGLAEVRSPLLLVLAVDMAEVADDWLRRGRALDGVGLVARLPSGLEPLAAWYPRAASALAAGRLHAGNRAVRGFAEACIDAGLMQVVDLEGEPARGFSSWNEPHDLPRY